MKELVAFAELGMFDMRDRGLNAYRETIQMDLMQKIKEALYEDLHKFVMVERFTDPLTGVMHIKASLRLLEPSDGHRTQFAYTPYEDMQMRLR